MKFDTNYNLEEDQLGQIFYDGLRPSIKLWINEIGRKQISWNDLVNAANQAETKACIYDNHHLDQRWPKGKWPLKIKNSGRDE